MSNIDKRDRLTESPFSYKISKSNKMFIQYNGKQIKILNEKQTNSFLAKNKNKSEFEIQLALAKITGNFKRGNEKNKSTKY